MSLIKKAATYRGYGVDSGVSKSSGGFPQYIIACQAVEVWDEDEQVWVDLTTTEDVELTAYQCLFGGNGEPTRSCEQIIKIFGWSGKSFSELADLDISQIPFQFRVEESEYNKKISLKVTWMDVADAIPGRQVRKLDVAGIKDLDAEFSKGLKSLTGTKVQKAAPATAKPTPGIVTQNAKPKPVAPKPVEQPEPTNAFDACMVDGADIAAISEAEEAEEDAKFAAAAASAKKAATIATAKAAKAASKPAAKKPGPPAKKVASSVEETSAAECDKDTAWNETYDRKAPGVDEDKFLKTWVQAVKDQMDTSEVSDEDELTGADWAAIKERIAGEVCIPF